MKKGKILILSCGTGGGHNSAALAVQENLIENGFCADFVEYLDIINPKLRNRVNRLYIKTTHGKGKVFKVVYHLGELYQKTSLKSPVYQLNSLSKKKLFSYIKNNEYDYIITTHLFAAQALTSIKKDYPIHFMAISTDYVCIPFWEETNPDCFIIPHEDLKNDFCQKGINKEKLLPFGIPVAKKYTTSYQKDDAKRLLNLDNNKNYILILTGSMGFGNVTDMIENLLNNMENIFFIVSCGNNNKLYRTLNNKYKNNSRLIILSYTKKLDEYMKSSDIILTKPGGLTTTEISNLRKPFIHTMPIPGCENYNANFFDERKMSKKCNSMQDVIQTTKKLFDNDKLQQQMIKNQEKYIKTDTCNKISATVIKFLGYKGENYEKKND